MSMRSDDALFDAIGGGGAVMGKSARMPAFGATLSSAEIRALVAYIRALCACRAPAWSVDGSRR
jgi:mono/diheme cytochrome c family protein